MRRILILTIIIMGIITVGVKCSSVEKKDTERENKIKELIKQLKDEDWEVRSSAAEDLGKLKAKEAIPQLIELLNNDEDYFVRISASLSLDLLGVSKTIPKPVEPMMKAMESIEQGYFGQALQYYKEILVFNPKESYAYYNLGILYDEHLDDPAHAIWCYMKYLELSPDDALDREWVKGWIKSCQKRLKK